MCALQKTGDMAGEAFWNLGGPQEIYCFVFLSPGKLRAFYLAPLSCYWERGRRRNVIIGNMLWTNESQKGDGSWWCVFVWVKGDEDRAVVYWGWPMVSHGWYRSQGEVPPCLISRASGCILWFSLGSCAAWPDDLGCQRGVVPTSPLAAGPLQDSPSARSREPWPAGDPSALLGAESGVLSKTFFGAGWNDAGADFVFMIRN